MEKFYRRNILIKLTAILIALFLWMFVSNEQNPTSQQEFTVPLEVRGKAAGVVTGDIPATVQVKVQGSRDVLRGLSPKDILAYIEMGQAHLGKNQLIVKADVPAQVELVSVKPARVEFNIETLKEKQVAVVPHLINSPAQGYINFEPVIKPSHVFVRGPEGLLTGITQVQVDIDLKNATRNLVQSLPLRINPKDLPSLGNYPIEIRPESVEVFVPVVKNAPSKSVPVKVKLTGVPAPGFAVKTIVTEPSKVEILGPPGILTGIESIETKEINIAQAEASISTETTLELPPNVSLASDQEIRIYIQIVEELSKKTLHGFPITVINKPEGITASFTPQEVDLTVEGPGKLVNKLNQDDIKVLLDLAGISTAGEHQGKLVVQLPQGFKLVKLNPETVTISVK